MDNGQLGYNCPMGKSSVFSGTFLKYCKWRIMDITMHTKMLKMAIVFRKIHSNLAINHMKHNFLKSTL
jgi:hypothetical protein